ncbi:MAG TPA: hypothetical protein VFW82_08025 [Dyella sp.]|nr:hypothetical protein [Dyella sp.]
MHTSRQRCWFDVAKVIAAPLALAVLEMFHPHPTDLLILDVRPWMLVHYAQIPLFALSALAVTALVRSHIDIAATVARIAMFVFALSFVAFDTVAGVAVGILVDSAQASGSPEAWRGAIDALWTHPIMGGMRLDGDPSLAVLGRVSLAIGTIAAAVSLKRSGSSWAPAGLLAISSLGINLLHSHSWPGGPLTFGGIALAAGWVQYEAATRAARASRTAIAFGRRAGDFSRES